MEESKILHFFFRSTPTKPFISKRNQYALLALRLQHERLALPRPGLAIYRLVRPDRWRNSISQIDRRRNQHAGPPPPPRSITLSPHHRSTSKNLLDPRPPQTGKRSSSSSSPRSSSRAASAPSRPARCSRACPRSPRGTGRSQAALEAAEGADRRGVEARRGGALVAGLFGARPRPGAFEKALRAKEDRPILIFNHVRELGVTERELFVGFIFHASLSLSTSAPRQKLAPSQASSLPLRLSLLPPPPLRSPGQTPRS